MTAFEELARVAEQIPTSGSIKTDTADFVVDEIMPVTPTGEGEHLWLHIRKTGANTEWVARQLARRAGVQPRDVSYAGLKDRQGVTSQWFSLHLPGKADPEDGIFNIEGVELLERRRHNRKLKRGTLSGNRFEITVRDLRGDLAWLETRLQQIQQQGVPNYFGEQRFGHGMENLVAAERMFQGERVQRHERSLYLSAARSWIFNRVLSERVRATNWNSHLHGDVFMLDGRSACFADDNSAEIEQRLQQLAIHPTGPLWGRGVSMAQADCLKLENSVAEQYQTFCRGLEQAGLEQERRALRVHVADLRWQMEASMLRLSFALPAGSYATMVLREIIA